MCPSKQGLHFCLFPIAMDVIDMHFDLQAMSSISKVYLALPQKYLIELNKRLDNAQEHIHCCFVIEIVCSTYWVIILTCQYRIFKYLDEAAWHEAAQQQLAFMIWCKNSNEIEISDAMQRQFLESISILTEIVLLRTIELLCNFFFHYN